jgi:hypothetical protein
MPVTSVRISDTDSGWACRTGDAVGAPESVADLADGTVVVGVGQAVGAVHIVDHADEGAEADHGETVGDALGHEGAHRGRVSRERVESPLGAPGGPLLPRVPVDLVSAGRTSGLTGAGDPFQVLVGQSPAGLGWRTGQPRDRCSEVGCVLLDVSGGLGDVCAKGVVAFVGIRGS